METAFVRYGTAHWIALLFTIALSAAMVVLGRKQAGASTGEFQLFRGYVIVTILSSQLYKLIVKGALPLEMCDLTGWIAIAALLTRHRMALALLYYWGLVLTPQALLTPALEAGFPTTRFLLFFSSHAAIVAAAAYVTWGLRTRTNWRLFAQAWMVAISIAPIMMVLNRCLGTNYMFVNAKPATSSLLDVLGPWPVYVLVELAVLGVIWALMTLPYTLKRS